MSVEWADDSSAEARLWRGVRISAQGSDFWGESCQIVRAAIVTTALMIQGIVIVIVIVIVVILVIVIVTHSNCNCVSNSTSNGLRITGVCPILPV